MSSSPLVNATIQSSSLAALSNFIAQVISSYRAEKPLAIDFADLTRFVVFSILMTPPNYLWQAWLEGRFPGYTTELSQMEKEKVVDDAVSSKATGVDHKDDLQKRTADKTMTEQQGYGKMLGKTQKRLNLKNTAIKFALDQTFGAAINNLLFLVGIALLRGESWVEVHMGVREKFWPVIFAGQKLWPAVSLLSFTVIPLERRTLFGSVVGLFWGIYLSLVSAKKG